MRTLSNKAVLNLTWSVSYFYFYLFLPLFKLVKKFDANTLLILRIQIQCTQNDKINIQTHISCSKYKEYFSHFTWPGTAVEVWLIEVCWQSLSACTCVANQNSWVYLSLLPTSESMTKTLELSTVLPVDKMLVWSCTHKLIVISSWTLVMSCTP